MKLDRLFILTGFAWVLAGMVFGIYLGITNQLALANTHAHTNLVGFVLSVLFGLVYHNWPALQEASLARIQFWVFEGGTVVFVAGKYVVDTGGSDTLVATGSVIVVAGTLMMAWLFMTKTSD